jgi:anti-sigma factor RsiW
MTCQRVWEAEAIEDGRLDAPSTASFERHLAACTECARALAGLLSMREAGSRLEPRRSSSLEHRRKRAELLRRANSQALRSPRLPSFYLFAVGALAAVVAVVGYRHLSRVVTARTGPADGVDRRLPAFELRPIGAAVWHDVSSLASARVVLTSGTLAVHVEHLLQGQRFVVALPDGELEVRGTRFIVEAEKDRTERVLVTEGVVALRLRGVPARSLTAGERYFPSNSEARSEPSSAAPPEPGPVDRSTGGKATNHMAISNVASRALRAPSDRTPLRAPAPRAATPADFPIGMVAGDADPNTASQSADAARTAPEAAPNGAVPGGVAGDAFHSAMAAFAMGSYAEADERFTEFVGRFPGDSRCEDAAFLRTVIALRRGDSAAAVARARGYLRRFPNGFRRDEIEQMIAAAGEGTPARQRR